MFLDTRKLPHTMGDLSVCRDLSNNVNKYNPDLIYYHNLHALVYQHCRITTQSKTGFTEKLRVEK